MSMRVWQVQTKRDRKRFITSQWQFYRGDPNWVPPLIVDRLKVLDEARNPFYQHAQQALFLAEEDGKIVGRIAAITNELHNQTHQDAIGFFGFFECVDRQEVADALFAQAESWLRQHGKTGMRGPMNPSMNDECGLLIEGHDLPPTVLMTYNPPYYARLIEQAGLGSVKDLLGYQFVKESYQTEKMVRLQNMLRERRKITVREVNFRDKAQYQRDLDTIKDIYNRAWVRNWGFVKMTDAEIDFMAKDLKQIADPSYALFAEVDGEVAGFILALPDINQVLIHNKSGRLLPALWHLLTKKQQITGQRTVILGVLPEYRKTGADAVLYYEVGARGVAKGLTMGEASWILEDNHEINNMLAHSVNSRLYKRYRLYQRDWHRDGVEPAVSRT